MPEIIPAVMPKTKGELKNLLSKIGGSVSWAQIDVMDGVFVPNISFPYKSSGIIEETFSEEGLPYWEDFNFEFDLMVKNPGLVLEKFIEAGAGRIIFHAESGSVDEIVAGINSLKEIEAEAVISLNNDTPLESLNPFIKEVSAVQLMGIARIGFQGEPFDERVIPRIRELREKYPDLIISIDGGVSLETAPRLAAAGANRLVVGSAIFSSGDIAEAIRKLKMI